MSKLRPTILQAVAPAVALLLGYAPLSASVQIAGFHATSVFAAHPKPNPSPSPSPGPTPSGANWIQAFKAPTLDKACASPYSQARDVQNTSDGGFVLAGDAQVSTSSTNCGAVYDGWIGKLSSSGRLQWQETFGCYGSNFYGLDSVQQTSDGGYVLAGGEEGCYRPQCVSGGFGTLNCAVVVKVDAAGQLQWQQFYPGAFQANANQVRQTSDGGYVVAGTTQDTSNNTYAWIAKLDPNGNAQWQKRIGGSCAAFAEADSAQQTSDGGYIVGGGFDYSSNCHASLLAMRLDASGNVMWQQAYPVGGLGGPNATIQPTSDGGYALAAIGGFQNAAGTSEDAVLLKLSSGGQIEWQNRYDVGTVCYYDYLGNYTCGDFGTLSYGMRQTADGGYVLAGDVTVIDPSDGLPVQPAWLVKVDASGTVQWAHDYYAVWPATGHVLGSNFAGVAQAGDGGFLAVGYREFYNLQADEVWVVKTDSNGNVGACSEVHSVTSSGLAAGLTPSTPSLPVNVVTNAGENVTSATSGANATLIAVQEC